MRKNAERSKIINVSRARELDRIALQKYFIPSIILMENAGRAVAEAALKFKPASAVIFCGCGNNGGDGFVAARHLFNKGVSATVVIMNDPDKYTGDALTNLKIISKFKIKIKKWNYWKTDFCSPDIIIDGLLGTGFKGEVREPYASAIKKINSFDKPVVSIDVPSGLNADTGCSGGETVNASVTVTMAAVKKGCIAKSALKFCGKIIVADIGLPRNFL